MRAAAFLDRNYSSGGQIVRHTVREGSVALDPPGIELTVDDPFVSVSRQEPGES